MIYGGSGGVGSLAIQMAKRVFKASFVATTSSNDAMCTENGADLVVHYDDDSLKKHTEEHKNSYDAVFDCVGGKGYWDMGANLLKRNGNYVTLCLDSGPGDNLSMTSLISKVIYRSARSLSPLTCNYSFMLTEQSGADLAVINKMVDDKLLKVYIDSEYDFTEDGVHAMFGKLMSYRCKGKVVCKIFEADAN